MKIFLNSWVAVKALYKKTKLETLQAASNISTHYDELKILDKIKKEAEPSMMSCDTHQYLVSYT